MSIRHIHQFYIQESGQIAVLRKQPILLDGPRQTVLLQAENSGFDTEENYVLCKSLKIYLLDTGRNLRQCRGWPYSSGIAFGFLPVNGDFSALSDVCLNELCTLYEHTV